MHELSGSVVEGSSSGAILVQLRAPHSKLQLCNKRWHQQRHLGMTVVRVFRGPLFPPPPRAGGGVEFRS